jgi:hypothetical protein
LKLAINRFSLSEMCSNNTGKTSGSGTMGILVTTVGTLCFAYGCIIKHSEIITQSTIVIGLGAALLGVRKMKEKASENAMGDETGQEKPSSDTTDAK